MIKFFKKIIGISKSRKTAKFSIGQPVCYDIKKEGRVVHSVVMEVFHINAESNPIKYHSGIKDRMLYRYLKRVN